MLLPIVMILFSSLSYDPDVWVHLKTYLLPELIENTLILSSGVLLATFIMGVSLAFLTSMCEFPGRAFFSWALLLPFAMPAYVMAFVYTGLLDFSGPVRIFLWTHLPAAALFFPEIRSTGGVILVMSLALYPYVFLLAGSGFSSQGENTLEAARSMGKSRMSLFFSVILPMARPWIFGGLILVFMETLADFGTVSIFNYNTFTTAIYKAWFGLFSVGAASRLSSILVLIVILVLSAEYTTRRKRENWEHYWVPAAVEKHPFSE